MGLLQSQVTNLLPGLAACLSFLKGFLETLILNPQIVSDESRCYLTPDGRSKRVALATIKLEQSLIKKEFVST